MSPIEFQAPWSRSLKVSTGIVVAMLSVLIVLGMFVGDHMGTEERVNLIGLSLFVLLGSAALMVRGYTLTQDEIVIRRPGWTTRLPMTTLQSVEGKADAMQGSWRLFGIGGLFSHIGWYWNRQLRFYRVYATDSSRAVILRYPNRIVVITPHDPQQFIMRAHFAENDCVQNIRAILWSPSEVAQLCFQSGDLRVHGRQLVIHFGGVLMGLDEVVQLDLQGISLIPVTSQYGFLHLARRHRIL